MQSKYNLVAVKNGCCHFARVTVEAEPKLIGLKVTEQIQEPIDEQECERSRKDYHTG